MAQIKDYPGLADNETAWEWEPGVVVIQIPCPNCDRGMLYAPARVCGDCGGHGYQIARRKGETNDENPCYPDTARPYGPQSGDPLGDDCKACGHLVALHSHGRACIGCEVLERAAAG